MLLLGLAGRLRRLRHAGYKHKVSDQVVVIVLLLQLMIKKRCDEICAPRVVDVLPDREG